MSNADGSRRLAVAIALAVVGCAANAPVEQAPAPASSVAYRPTREPPRPATIPALRRALAAAADEGELRVLSMRLAGMLRAAGRAGDLGAEDEAADVLRSLVRSSPASLSDPAVGDLLASTLVLVRSRSEALALAQHLACPERFAYVAGKGAANPQDHPAPYWDAWERAHEEPVDVTTREAKRAPFVASPGGPASRDEETTYRPLYAECAGGTAARWTEVATHHLEADAAAGPFRTNRAAEAYRLAVRRGGPGALRARALLGSVYALREERDRAVTELSGYLSACAGPSRRQEECDPPTQAIAVRELGECLTYGELHGTPESAPYVPRRDVVDTIVRPDELSRALGVVLVRLRDPSLVPPSTGAVVPIHVAAALALADLEQPAVAADVLDAAARIDPAHPELPRTYATIGALRRRMGTFQRPPLGEPHQRSAIAAWQAVLDVTAPASAWTTANARDDQARAEAAELRAAAPREIAAVQRDLAVARAIAMGRETEPRSPGKLARAFVAAREALSAAVAAGETIGADALRDELDLEELVARSRAGDALPDADWVRAREPLAPPVGDEARSRADVRRVRVADAWIAHDERRFAATRGKEGARPAPFEHAPGSALRRVPRIDPLPPSVVEAVAARRASAEHHAAGGRREAAARALVVAAELLLARGRADDAAPLLDEALAVGCKERSGFAAFLLRADVARAANDRATLAALAARNDDGGATCAKTPADRAAGKRATGTR